MSTKANKTYEEQKSAFLEFLTKEFGHTDESLTPWSWTYEVIENMIDYVYREHGHVKGAAIRIIASLLPEVEESEVREYLPEYSEESEPADEPDAVPDDSLPIGKDLIREALHEGIIEVRDDDIDSGIITVIGSDWMYLADTELTSREYLELMPENDIVDKIYADLEKMRNRLLNNEADGSEWFSMKQYLDEHVRMERITERASDWELVSEDPLKYIRSLGDMKYELVEQAVIVKAADFEFEEKPYGMVHDVIDLNGFSEEEIRDETAWYYPSLEDLRAECGASSPRVVAEIIFENWVEDGIFETEPMTEKESVKAVKKLVKNK